MKNRIINKIYTRIMNYFLRSQRFEDHETYRFRSGFSSPPLEPYEMDPPQFISGEPISGECGPFDFQLTPGEIAMPVDEISNAEVVKFEPKKPKLIDRLPRKVKMGNS